MQKFIFITGGVVSSLGKGIVASSIGNLLKANGHKVRIKKLDPYLNVDPGTMNPVQHGEVFVTNDGGETDLDLGHYERFTGVNASREDNTTSGQIYQKLIQKERNGDYMGKTVQVIPHVTDLIKDFIVNGSENQEFTICEIGGTVGDIEGQPFLEAIRQIRYEFPKDTTLLIHVTLLPYIAPSDEVKTKPTQHSVKILMSAGIIPDILVCRTQHKISDGDKKKLALFCNINVSNIMEAPDVRNIYELPVIYKENNLLEMILKHFHLDTGNAFITNMLPWTNFINKMNNASVVKKVYICGKYTKSKDAYKSLNEAIIHAGAYLDIRPEIIYIDSREIINQPSAKQHLNDADCIIVAGGFGLDGIDGKIEAIRFARENNVPFLGICLGMQLAVIEFVRNVCGLDVTSEEFGSGEAIVGIMNDKRGAIGGTMRLGMYQANIKVDTLAYTVYQSNLIEERHRHRYEIYDKYEDLISDKGGTISAKSCSENLPEIFELQNHKFFISTQFHPEFNSSPLNPNKIFLALLKSTKC